MTSKMAELTLRQEIRLARHEPMFTNPTCELCKYIGSAVYKHSSGSVGRGYDLFQCSKHSVSPSYAGLSNLHNLIWVFRRGEEDSTTTSSYCEAGSADALLKNYTLYHKDVLVPLLRDVRDNQRGKRIKST